jgi:hypothetical protein
MAKKTVFSCDCGCGATLKSETNAPCGWFTLSQNGLFLDKNPDPDMPKIERDMHFAQLECVMKWSALAAREAATLQSEAANIRPRGNFESTKVDGLYV